MKSKSPQSMRYLPAQKIIPKDDTFHGSKYLLDIEWWYFDAVFDNGMSAHIGFRIYHIRGIGILQVRINIYDNGTLVKEKINRFPLKNIIIDKKKPEVIINDKKIILFDIKKDNLKNIWTYEINLSIEEVTVQLNYSGNTEGWKIETDSTCWTVPLPKATVEGTISINQKTEKVKGTGYHDHNWGYSPTTVLQNIGWYWGRITANKLHITWANTIISKTKQDLITVVNKPYNNQTKTPFFTSIKPKDIQLTTKEFKEHKKVLIPHTFELTFNQQNTSSQPKITGNITMKTIDVHYDRIFIINYWRYHVLASGSLTYGEITETIKNKPQIIEYLKF